MPEPGVPLGRLGFGVASLGNLFMELSDERAFEILDEAWAAGIRSFDTAPHYGLGLSERRIGTFLATKPRDEFVLSTKVGRLLEPDPGADGLDDEGFRVPATMKRVWGFDADAVRRSLDASLERLGLDRVDIVYIHDPERSDIGLDAALATAVPAVAALRDEGVVGQVGIGTMVNEAVVAAVRTGALDLAMIANRLTLADHSALDEAVPACREHGVGVVAAAVFNTGLLAHAEPHGRFEYADADPQLLRRVRRIAAVCASHGVDVPTAALHYPLRRGAQTVVVGANGPGQIAQNAARLETHVPEELWAELEADGL
ncbi:aldo/keto reductase [Gryllotalpicola koreensis]|uniref:Aldo/keto reductase n=1 Tax=Gryllotalpicola koreensis TaxID=993086 RepID=A0ABP7ZRK7_9MICO